MTASRVGLETNTHEKASSSDHIKRETVKQQGRIAHIYGSITAFRAVLDTDTRHSKRKSRFQITKDRRTEAVEQQGRMAEKYAAHAVIQLQTQKGPWNMDAC